MLRIYVTVIVGLAIAVILLCIFRKQLVKFIFSNILSAGVIKQHIAKWYNWLIGVLTAVIVGILVVNSSEIYKSSIYFANDILFNISSETALEIAKQKLGAGAIKALPFKNRKSKTQYIAVLDRTDILDKPHGEPTIKILEGIGSVYQVINTEIDTYNMLTRDYPFGVIDANGDGYKEIYGVCYDGGSGVYIISIKIYDTYTQDTYTLNGYAQYNDFMPKIEFSDNLNDKENFKNWLVEKLSEYIIRIPNKSEYTNAVYNWRRKNGTDFIDGVIDIEHYNGRISNTACVTCKIDDGNCIWYSYFKGELCCYVKSTNRSYIVWVPTDAYNWIEILCSGKNWIWFETHYNDIIAFNKTQYTMKKIEDSTYSIKDLISLERKGRLNKISAINIKGEFSNYLIDNIH